MDFPQAHAVLQQGLEAGLHSGAQLYVSQHGETRINAAWGENTETVPLRPETRMAWFSAGKPLTAVAVAIQAEAGRLSFDDPVARHLPKFAAGGKEAITVRHLLTHTAGFRSADLLPEDLSWDETVARICAAPLEENWIPGGRAGYQLTSSWFILGEIVARLANRNFNDYIREHILDPLGMTGATLAMTPEEIERLRDEIGWIYSTQSGRKAHPFFNTPRGWQLCRPGSSARGPVAALGRFYEFLLGFAAPKRPVISRATIQTLVARHRAGMRDETFQHPVDFGLGFLLNSNRYGVETVPYGYGRFASDAAFGHSGHQCSCGFADPAHGLVVAWACNGQPGEPRHQRRARELNSAIYADLGLAS